MKNAKILFVSQEITPFLVVTEVSNIARKLPQGIQEKGREIRTFMPRFGLINERRNQLHEVIRLSGMNLIIDESDHPLMIKVASIQSARMQVYFIDNEEYFQRKTIFRDAKKKFFQPHSVVKGEAGGWRLAADPNGFFTSYAKDGRFVSYYGDNHPRYAGNVVKAMASAKDGFRHVVDLFASDLTKLDAAAQPARDAQWARLVSTLDHDLTAKVARVERLTDTIVEVVVRAPRAARRFEPGQHGPAVDGGKLRTGYDDRTGSAADGLEGGFQGQPGGILPAPPEEHVFEEVADPR